MRAIAFTAATVVLAGAPQCRCVVTAEILLAQKLYSHVGPKLALEMIYEHEILKKFLGGGGHAPRPPYMLHTYT